MADDPFTLVNKAIWDALLGFQPFRDAMQLDGADRPANWVGTVTHTGVAGQALETKPPAHFPWVFLTQRGFRLTPFGSNSKVAEAVQVYTLQLTDGNRAKNEKLNRLKWTAFLALTLVSELPDLGLPDLVRQWAITDAQEGPPLDDEGRPQPQWAALFNVEVSMHWPRTHLRSLANP